MDGHRLRVCIWPDYFSITYRNPKTLQLSGIDIEMAMALGKDHSVAVTFVASSFARLADDLLHDRCDLAMLAVGITPERQKRLRITEPYLASDICAVTSKTNRRIRSCWCSTRLSPASKRCRLAALMCS